MIFMQHHRVLQVWLTAILATLFTGIGEHTSGQSPDGSSLPTEQRESLINLRREYRVAADLDAKRQVVQKAIGMGELGVGRLAPVVRKELMRSMRMYVNGFAAHLRRTEKSQSSLSDVLAADPRLARGRDQMLVLASLAEQLAAASLNQSKDMRSFQKYLTPVEKRLLRLHRFGRILAQLDDQEAIAIQEANRRRMEHGASPLTVDIKLCKAARGHSQDMVKHGFFGHSSPVPGKAAFTEGARLAGTTASAENCMQGGPSGKGAIEAWMNSPPHRVNLLASGIHRIGIGRAGGTFTAMFGH